MKLLPALAERLNARVLVPPLAVTRQEGCYEPRDILHDAHTAIAIYRHRLHQQLIGVLAAWNAAGIEPLLLKGARSLWTGEPGWRYLVDLDLLVPHSQLSKARDTLAAVGYEAEDGFRLRDWSHHIAPLGRDGEPALVEIHHRGANRYAEPLLPTTELWRASGVEERHSVRARVLPDGLHLLHGLLHHHVGHRGDADRTLSIRGLYEMAWAFVRLDDDERRALHGRCSQDLRTATAVDLWLAAAHELFAMPVEAPFRVHDDARAWWRTLLGRAETAPVPRWLEAKLGGYAETYRLALNSERLARSGCSASLLGKARALSQIAGSFARPKLARILP